MKIIVQYSLLMTNTHYEIYPISIGDTVEVLPGYSMDTGRRTNIDEITDRVACVVSIYKGREAEIEVRGMSDTYWLPVQRLRRCRA